MKGRIWQVAMALAILSPVPLQAQDEKHAGELIKAMTADPHYVALKAKADAGDPAAMVELADLIHYSLTGPGRFGADAIALKGRMRLLDQAVQMGYVPAIKQLALMAMMGDGIAQNKPAAREYYRIAAEKGDVEAIMIAAELHRDDPSPFYRGIAGERSTQDILSGREKSMAEILADLKNWSTKPTGPLIYNGDEAIRLLSLPAVSNHAPALRTMAGIYLNGTNLKDGPQPQKAIKIFEGMAKRDDPKAYSALGNIYFLGAQDLKPDPARAALYYGQAAMLGDGYSAHQLGFMNVVGKGVPKNDAEAVRLFMQSAKAGYAKGMTSLGVCYLEGRGVPKSEKLAAAWFEKAGDAGDMEGAFNAGRIWDSGVEGVRNPMRAFINYKKAADGGYAKARDLMKSWKPN